MLELLYSMQLGLKKGSHYFCTFMFVLYVSHFILVVFHMDEVLRSTGLCVWIKRVASVPCVLCVLRRSPSSPCGCRCIIHHHRLCTGADSQCQYQSGEDIISLTQPLDTNCHSETWQYIKCTATWCKIDKAGLFFFKNRGCGWKFEKFGLELENVYNKKHPVIRMLSSYF